MTRANIEIIQDAFPKKTHLEIGSDGYPSILLKSMLTFLSYHIWYWAIENKEKIRFYQQIQNGAFADFIQETWAKPGGVGNWSYTYVIDLIKGTLTVYEPTNRWYYAPENWEEKGGNYPETKNGRAGYTGTIKGKKIYHISIDEIIDNNQIIEKGKYIDKSYKVGK